MLPRRKIPRWMLLVFLATAILVTIPNDIPLGFLRQVAGRLPDFATVFLRIFIEAAPFLLFGTLASGIVEVFFSKDAFAQ